MARESYAASVARHTEIMWELFTALHEVRVGDPEERAISRSFVASLTEIQRLTQLRLDKSDYEYQRRQGKVLADLARVVAPRG
jgi:hypothetical protein